MASNDLAYRLSTTLRDLSLGLCGDGLFQDCCVLKREEGGGTLAANVSSLGASARIVSVFGNSLALLLGLSLDSIIGGSMRHSSSSVSSVSVARE